jgi:predicted metal-dependent HD superfamily phosphohydrolase
MSAQDICSSGRWTRLCEGLGLSNDTRIYTALIAAHAEKHRAYHTLDHIAACLKHLDRVKDKVDRPDEIELALWFHDAIYQPFSATNEEDSADWAVKWLLEQGAQANLIHRVRDHILATKTHKTPDQIDG